MALGVYQFSDMSAGYRCFAARSIASVRHVTCLLFVV